MIVVERAITARVWACDPPLARAPERLVGYLVGALGTCSWLEPMYVIRLQAHHCQVKQACCQVQAGA